MKLVDSNVLLNATNQEARGHEAAATWLRRSLVGDDAVGFAWIALLGFLRVSTLHSVFPEALDVRDALIVVERWLAAPAAEVVHPTTKHAEVLRRLLEAVGTGGNLVPDAHLAALAIEHRGQLISFDTDFARFPGLRWERLA